MEKELKMSDEHSKIEFDIDQDSFESLHGLIGNRLSTICCRSSMTIYEEFEIGDQNLEELFKSIGQTIFNEVIVDALKAKIDEENGTEDWEDDEERMNIIGQKGNDGLHYDEDEDSIYHRGES